MKCLVISCWLLAVSCWSAARADEELPRNPFWPQGYEGTRYVISDEPRFKAEPPEPAETNAVKTTAASVKPLAGKMADLTEDPVWNEALKALRFGSTMGFSANGKSQAAITINDRIYAVGELVSANFLGYRFTWRIESLSTDGKIKLKRITYRKTVTNP